MDRCCHQHCISPINGKDIPQHPSSSRFPTLRTLCQPASCSALHAGPQAVRMQQLMQRWLVCHESLPGLCTQPDGHSRQAVPLRLIACSGRTGNTSCTTSLLSGHQPQCKPDTSRTRLKTPCMSIFIPSLVQLRLAKDRCYGLQNGSSVFCGSHGQLP